MLVTVLIVSTLLGMRYGLIRAALVTIGVYIGWIIAGQYSAKIAEQFSSSNQVDKFVTVLAYIIIMASIFVLSSKMAKIVKPLLTVFTLGLSNFLDKLGGLVMGMLVGIAISGALILGLARFTYTFDTNSYVGSITGQISQHFNRLDQVKATLEKSDLGTEVQHRLGKVEDIKNALGDSLTEAQITKQMENIADLKNIVEESQEGPERTQQLSNLAEIDTAFRNANRSMSARIEETQDFLETALTQSHLVDVFIIASDTLPYGGFGIVPEDFRVGIEILRKKIKLTPKS